MPVAEKTAFVSALEHFASTLSQWSASPISARLQILLRTPPLAIANGDGIPNFTFADISAFFTDLPIVTTRAGLYILLNASLTARPVLDDFVILSHLRARYPSDTQAMLVDLVIASFDALANALHRRDTSHVVLCYRSFIANKVPLLLTSLSVELFPPLTAQYCIQVALGRISIQPFPPLSSDNDGDAINRVLRDCQRDFLSACQMHHLIGEASIPGHSIPSSSLPRRHIKANLIAQCVGSISRAEILIAELDNMHGNTGPISSALVETLQHLCDTKETMSLRTLCNALSRQIALVDIVLQHASLNSFLLPLCGLLNEWTHDEDQSEFQPPYEEFAAILLLVLALVYRYDISTMDLEFIGIHGYVPKLLSGLSKSIPVEDLTHDQDQQLKKWIEGLYATDDQGETTGIGDETMSQCPPQAFYLLVPTLFEQSVQACSANYLALNTLKGGLEFLLEPFLLPSLVGGLRWLINHSWQDRGDTEILLQVLQKLLLPTSISGDAQSMHRTILAIVAAPLAHSLQALSKRMPNRGDIGALIEVLAPYSNSQRSLKSTRAELQKWTSRPDGGIRRNVTELVDGLIVWSLQADINPVPKSYTHRMLAAAIMMLGVDAVLDAIVEAVQRGASPAALEVGTALICAPMSIGLAPATSMSFDGGGPGFSGQRRSLRQALRLLLDDTKYILEQENEGGQTLIRLGRLVEAQSAVSQVPLTMPLSNIGTQELMQSIDMTGVDLSGTQLMQPPGDLPDVSTADFAAVMSQSMDMSAATVDMNAMNDVNALQMDLSDNLFATSTDLNLGLDPTQEENADVQAFNRQTENVAQSTNDDDIFAGLDLGEMGMGDDEFNF